MPSPRPVKPSPSLVVALMLTRSEAMPRTSPVADRHRRPVRPDPGSLADDHQIHVLDPSTTCGQDGRGVAQEARRIGVAPLRVVGREVAANVAGRYRAQDRVGDRVEGHVRVGMADQAQLVGYADPTQDQGSLWREGMHIEPEPRAPACAADEKALSGLQVLRAA